VQIAATTQAQPSRLANTIGRWGYFTLAFGAVVGSGWVVVLGEWLRTAGPGGTMIGFLAGGLVMMLIALCYGELVARFASAGGEFLYTLETFGPRAGFFVAWFLTLYAIAVCAFEAVACAWFIKALLPAAGLGTAYTLAGTAVTVEALLIGVGGALAIGALHYSGARSAIGFQNVVTFGFIAVIALLILSGVTLGSPRNLQPWWEPTADHSWLMGALAIFPTCAFFLNGWQAALHAIEERHPKVSPRAAVFSMVAAILAAAVFYVTITLSAASAVPWQTLVTEDLAAEAAFSALLPNGILGSVVLLAAIISLIKTWSAMAWIASRLLFAQARHGLLPAAFADVDSRTGAPRTAIVFVTVCTIAGLLLGRGALLPIVDMVSICIALSMILCIVVLLKRIRLDARSSSDTPTPGFVVPGGRPVIVLALVAAVAMISAALVQPLLRGATAIPLEWILLAGWGALGAIVWMMTHRKR
jgi:basic amino acid/polyamine antiporter, APA family